MGRESLWSPFKRNGKLRVVFYTDPWWKRALARLRGEPLWHRMGAMGGSGTFGFDSEPARWVD
jgi:hypothetical protein